MYSQRDKISVVFFLSPTHTAHARGTNCSHLENVEGQIKLITCTQIRENLEPNSFTVGAKILSKWSLAMTAIRGESKGGGRGEELKQTTKLVLKYKNIRVYERHIIILK